MLLNNSLPKSLPKIGIDLNLNGAKTVKSGAMGNLNIGGSQNYRT